MSYALAMERLNALAAELHTAPGAERRKFRLEDMRILLAALGDPQHSFPSVLIAGTNGKGSTAATLASILQTAGCLTGLYTSPHLTRPNERIQVGGEAVSDDEFAALYFEVEKAAQLLVASGALTAMPSFFEAITAMAFLHFSGWGNGLDARAGVDIAVLEVGLGGRLDATNVVEPLLSIITDISLDHTEWLGPTVDAIAREKAGILRPGGVLITLPQHPEASQAIGEIAMALGVRAVNAAAYIPVDDHSTKLALNRYTISVLGESIDVDSPLAGRHQQRNIALAIAAAVELGNLRESGGSGPGPSICSYKITPAAIEHGIRNTSWPGRLEVFRQPDGKGSREFLLDVAHNPAGAWALRSAVSQLLEERQRSLTLIFGCLKDKAIDEIAQILFPIFDELVLVEVDSPRAASLGQMLAAAARTGSKPHSAINAADALAIAAGITSQDGTIVVAGSVYLVGALRQLLTASPATGVAPPFQGDAFREPPGVGVGDGRVEERERVR